MVAVGAGAVALTPVVAGGTGTTWGVTAAAAATACAPKADSYSPAVLADKPVAWYRLDEARGPTLCDASTRKRPGTYTGSGVRYSAAGAVPGDHAVTATGASGGVGTGGTGSGLTGNHAFTLEAWFRATGTHHDQSVINMGQPGRGNIAGLSVWTADTGSGAASQLALDQYVGAPQAGTNNIWDTGTVGVNLWDGRWHQVAVTYAPGTKLATGYVDGHRLGAFTPPATASLQASAVRLGWWVDTVINQPLVGALDEAAVYPSALSAARVKQHYVASGAPFDATRPTITGTPKVGTRLTGTAGSWSPSTGLTFSRQWEICPRPGATCTAIAKATGAAYTPTAAQAGHDLVVVVTATNARGQKASVSSAAVGPVSS